MLAGIKCIVGLGNPEPRYNNTPHNLGFMFIDTIGKKAVFKDDVKKKVAQIQLSQNRTLLLVKPMCYMNCSGKPLQSICQTLKYQPDEILIVHDDARNKPYVHKVQFGGGSGGHNGLRSITAAIGPDYWRLRLGIGSPSNVLLSTYVLQQFSAIDRVQWHTTLQQVESELLSLLHA